jgi:molybdenum cofactor cytidylyltransferase
MSSFKTTSLSRRGKVLDKYNRKGLRRGVKREKTMECLMPAAGFSQRMGRDKLELRFGERTALELSLANALEACARVILVAAPGAEHSAARKTPRIVIVENPRPEDGMLSSIKAGLPSVKAEAFFVAPADMPFLGPELFGEVLAAFRGFPVLPTFQGRPGHPVLIPSRLIPGILALPPGSRVRTFLMGQSHDFLATENPGSAMDLDTPEDYENALHYFFRDPGLPPSGAVS